MRGLTGRAGPSGRAQAVRNTAMGRGGQFEKVMRIGS
jgi:hypothetical protein